MNTSNMPDLNRTGESSNSKIDLFSGKHTTAIIVAILFLVTLICFIILVCYKDDLPESIITGLIGLLSALVGFFAGSNAKKDN